MLQHWLSPNRRRARELSVISPKLPKCQRKCVGDFGSSFWRLNSAASSKKTDVYANALYLCLFLRGSQTEYSHDKARDMGTGRGSSATSTKFSTDIKSCLSVSSYSNNIQE